MEPKTPSSQAASSLSNLQNSMNAGIPPVGRIIPPLQQMSQPSMQTPPQQPAPQTMTPPFSSPQQPAPQAPSAPFQQQPIAQNTFAQQPVGYSQRITPQQAYAPSSYTPPPTPPQTQSAYPHAPNQTYASVQHAQRRGPMLIVAFLLTLLIMTGALYVYGSYLLNQNTLPAATTQEIPTNGFQVTESGITEPNFEQEYSTPYTQDINTDTSNMFENLE